MAACTVDLTLRSPVTTTLKTFVEMLLIGVQISAEIANRNVKTLGSI